MLEENKELFITCADSIDWRNLSKNELANLYIENESKEIASVYLSALVLKYWHLIGSYYSRQGIKYATPEDCYDWVIEGISKALRERAWLNPESTIYKDEKGPEKAIVVCISCIRANFYQAIKHDKRNLNYNSLSLDELEDNSSDGYYLPYNDKYNLLSDYVKELIVEYFNQKDYFISFFCDALFNNDILVENNEEEYYNINIGKYNKYVTEMTPEYLKLFAKTNDLDYGLVTKAFEYIQMMPSYRVHSNISRAINLFSSDDKLFSLLETE